jgi:hypothetical protein
MDKELTMNTDNHDIRDPALAAPLDALRAATAHLDTPRGVEKELMAAFARRQAPRKWYRRLSPLQWSLAGGAGAMAVMAMAFLLVLRAPLPAIDAGAPLPVIDNGGAFVALESLERIEQEEAPRMVETDVPRSALASLGIPVTPENAGDSVRAELLVSADGEPLALRLSVH